MNVRRLPIELVALIALLLGMLPLARAEGGAHAGEPLPSSFEHIRVLDFRGPIGPIQAAYVDRQASRAFDDGVDCLVVRIESPGGTVLHSQKTADRLLEVPDSIHVVAWIPKEAYSGAAMVALACDEIVMRPEAHFGDAQPGMILPEGWKPVGEKAESPLRAKFQVYAETNGYPVALAEAMVSARMEVVRVRAPDGSTHYVNGKDFREWDPEAEVFPGVRRSELVQVGEPVVREEELLTLTGREAARYGFLRRTFGESGDPFPADEEAFLEAIQAPGAVVDQVEPSFSESASQVLLDLAGILSAVVAIALLMMLWQGPGIMTVVGGVALVLIVVINLTADQLHGFPLFLLAVGVLLLLAEVFVLPGFGIAGVLGVLALGTGFLFLAAGATFDDTRGVTGELAVDFGLQFVLTVILGLGVLFAMSRLLPTVGPARRMVLAAPGAPPARVRAATAASVAIGERGVATSTLRPAGTVEIQGRLVDVVTDGSFIAAGTRVEVTAVEGNRVSVRALEPGPDDEEP